MKRGGRKRERMGPEKYYCTRPLLVPGATTAAAYNAHGAIRGIGIGLGMYRRLLYLIRVVYRWRREKRVRETKRGGILLH